jgi:hypothetical protein
MTDLTHEAYGIKVYIYALINPIDDTVFYIGSTKYHLKYRLSGHLNITNGCRKDRAELITTILDAGLKPEIFLLDTTTVSESGKLEEFYYYLFKSYGYNLMQSKTGFHYTKSITSRIEWDVESGEYERRKNPIIEKILLPSKEYFLEVKRIAKKGGRTVNGYFLHLIDTVIEKDKEEKRKLRLLKKSAKLEAQ